MTLLDRPGRFKAIPRQWRIKQFDASQAIAIGIEFDIVAQWDGSQWIDWTSYDAQVWGDWFVVMKDGKPNEKPVLQLATSLGWFGGLRDILDAPPPRKVVQLTVKPDTYQGTTRHKATWMDPEDADPNAAGEQGPSPEKVSVLDAKIGSQLRALAGKAARKPVDDIPF